MNKIGVNVHDRMTYNRGYSADEEAYLFDFLKDLRPTALVFLENLEWAKRAKALLPQCKVVLRPYDPAGGAFHLPPDGSPAGTPARLSPKEHFARYASRVVGTGVILQVLSEPNGYGASLKALNTWLPEVLDMYGKAGIAVCGPSFGEGHPDESAVALAQLDDVWDAFDKWHDLHFYSTNEYGTWRGMLFHESGAYDVYPWRVGRFESFVKPYLEKHGHQVPNVIVTECGIDSAHDGIEKRGWKDSFSEHDYFDQLQAAVKRVYSAPHYVGVCLFSYGNTGRQFTQDDWTSFDLSDAKTLHELLKKSGTITAELPAIPAPVVIQPPPAVPPAIPQLPVDILPKPSTPVPTDDIKALLVRLDNLKADFDRMDARLKKVEAVIDQTLTSAERLLDLIKPAA